MSKKTLIIVGAVVLVILAAATGIYIASSTQKATSESPSSFFPVTNPFAPEEEEDASYNDESGFSFMYPKSLKVEDTTPEDNAYYSVLALSKDGQSLKITVKDTADKKINVDGELLGALSLDGVAAKQFQKGTILVTAAIDQGVLYLIEGPKDDGFWEEAQNKIASTFKFGKQETTVVETGSSDNTSYEEEIVE